MQRRTFIGGLAAILADPLFSPDAGAEQPTKRPVIGYLSGVSPGDSVPALTAFRQGLGEAGYAEGQSVAIEYRWAEFQYDRASALAADLVRRKVDVIVTSGGDPTAFAAKAVTSTIPIVNVFGGDPVATGLVASLARPGGNLTGFSLFTADLMPKRLELLSELVPQAGMFGLRVNENSHPERIIRDVQEAARTKGVQLQILNAGTEGEFETAFASLVQSRAGALLVANDPFWFGRRDQLVALAARYAVPAVYEWREFTVAGGLISYGTSRAGMYRQVGIYAGKILKGAKPADLPVQQPTIFELVVNLKTAKALGLTVPPSILARADEVIE